MCSHRARSDPPAHFSQALSFIENEMAETVSLHPEDSGISSSFKISGETGNTPNFEEDRGISKPCNNNELKSFLSHCPEKLNLFTSENQFGVQLGQNEDSEDIFEWKTEREKLEKENGNVFITEINDAHNSPFSVTCLESQPCPDKAQDMKGHDKNVLTNTNFVLGDNTAVNTESTRMPAINARQEVESSPNDKMDTGHLHCALHLIEKQRGADRRESFVENNDSADRGKDDSVLPPEDSKRTGQYALVEC